MGGGVMRSAAKVAGLGVVNTGFRRGFQLTPSSAEPSAMRVASRPVSSAMTASRGGDYTVSDAAVSANRSWEMVDDWEFAGGVEEEMALGGSTAGGGEPMARVVFGGVPSLEEAKEATADLKDALDKVYLSSPNSADTALASDLLVLSNPEETKNCVASNVKATSVPKSAIQAFKLLNESPQVQSVVASIATDPNVWNAVTNNSAYMEFVLSQKTSDKFEYHGSPQSSESSVKLEEYSDSSQPKDNGNRFSNFLLNVKTTAVEMVYKATDFVQSLFTSPSAENDKENAGSPFNSSEKTFAAGLFGLVVMVIMVVLMKRV